MRKNKSPSLIIKHKDKALNSLNDFLNNLINSKNADNQSKVDKICYWLETYASFLEYEKEFSPLSRCKYKRGQIIKADFGFRIGSEYGGLHYAIVTDINNSKYSTSVTVVPLTSVKDDFDKCNMKKGQIYLGDEIYTSLSDKNNAIKHEVGKRINQLKEEILNSSSTVSELIEKELDSLEKKMDLIHKINAEISKMKHGSIALVSQITTISKIRISDPRTSNGVLHGIKISTENLDLIDEKIKKLYTLNKDMY